MARSRNPARRGSIRAEIAAEEISGLITRPSVADHINFVIWDISETGLGLWVSGKIYPGERIRIAVGQPYMMTMEGEVMWCELSKTESGFRCGVNIKDGSTKLKTLYDSAYKKEAWATKRTWPGT